MRKIYTLIVALIATMTFVPAVAQTNIYLWGADGTLHVGNVDKVDSITFSAPSGIFEYTMTDEKVTDDTYEVNITVKLNETIKDIDSAEEPDFGLVYSPKNKVPTLDDMQLVVGTGLNKEHSIQLSNLLPGTTYYCRLGGAVGYDVVYGEVFTFTTSGEKPADKSKVVNGHKFVDLGLTSRTLWAETNLGATDANPIGNYYAWGETAAKSAYTQENSKWYDQAYEGTELNSEDDAATAAWGDEVRMPTAAEAQELVDNCSWTLTTVNGVEGYLVESKVNSNSIFLPKTGCRRSAEDVLYSEDDSYFWTSTPGDDNEEGASVNVTTDTDVFGHEKATATCNHSEARYYGFPIRPVTSGK